MCRPWDGSDQNDSSLPVSDTPIAWSRTIVVQLKFEYWGSELKNKLVNILTFSILIAKQKSHLCTVQQPIFWTYISV